MEKKVIALISILIIIIAAMGSWITWTTFIQPEGEEKEMPPEVRAVEYRDPAEEGKSPAPFSEVGEFTNLDVVPKRKYFIAFSNSAMGTAWREVFVRDMTGVASEYAKEFGIKFVWTNAFGDATRQLADVEMLLAQRPDLLIISPEDSVILDPVYDMCEDAGIPFMTVDRSIVREPGTAMYITQMFGNNYWVGVARGILIVEALTQKYGRPVGHVAEISGSQTAEIGVERSAGTHRVLAQYPDIRVVACAEGEWIVDKIITRIRELLVAYPDIDVMAVDPEIYEGGMAVVEEMEREDVMFLMIDGHRSTFDFMTDPELKDTVRGTVEYAPAFGLFAFATAIQYLNGEDVETRYILPTRVYSNLYPEMVPIVAEFHQNFQDNPDIAFPMGAWGYYEELSMYDEISQYYPTPYEHWETEGFLEEYPAFATESKLPTWPPT